MTIRAVLWDMGGVILRTEDPSGRRQWEERLGLAPGERLILQPTRIVQRKGIEHAIELAARLGRKAVLVVGLAGLTLANLIGALTLGTPQFVIADVIASITVIAVLPMCIATITLLYHRLE